MKRLRWIMVSVLVLFLGTAVYLYQYGAWRVKRDLAVFSEHVITCTPFDQHYYAPMIGDTMNRSVVGPRGDLCQITFDALGAQEIDCAVAETALPELAEALLDQGRSVDIFGYADLRISTSNPDPLTRLMNGDACRVSGG